MDIPDQQGNVVPVTEWQDCDPPEHWAHHKMGGIFPISHFSFPISHFPSPLHFPSSPSCLPHPKPANISWKKTPKTFWAWHLALDAIPKYQHLQDCLTAGKNEFHLFFCYAVMKLNFFRIPKEEGPSIKEKKPISHRTKPPPEPLSRLEFPGTLELNSKMPLNHQNLPQIRHWPPQMFRDAVNQRNGIKSQQSFVGRKYSCTKLPQP